MKGQRQRVICPICKLERWVEVSDVLLIPHINQIIVLTVFFAFLLFPWLQFRVLGLAPVVWMVFEVARGLVNRQRMVCPQCHFDPFLYKANRAAARERCETRLQSLKDRLTPPSSP